MKRAYLKMMMRGVKGSFSRFLSILGIVALGSGFLAGLLAATPDMEQGADLFFDEMAVYDLDVKGTLGVTAQDVEALLERDEVEAVMPGYSTDVLLDTEEDKGIVTRLFGVLDLEGTEPALNKVSLLEGRYPQRADECLLIQLPGYAGGHTLGDVFTLSPGTENPEDTYAVSTFTVVGVARSPLFLSVEADRTTVGDGEIDMALYLPKEAYALSVYTDLYVTLAGLREENTFSDAYFGRIDQVTEDWEPLGKERSALRLDEVRREAEEKLQDAEEEYREQRAEAEEELNDAARQIADAEQEIADGYRELADGEQKILDGERELADGRREIADAEREIADGERELEENAEFVQKLRDAKAEGISLDESLIDDYDQAVKDVAEGKEELEKNRAKIEEGREALREGQKELDDAESQLQSGASSLAAGRREFESQKAQAEAGLEAAQAEISAKEAELAAGRQQLEAGKAELAQAEAGLAALQSSIASLESIPPELLTAEQAALLETLRGEYASGQAQAEAARSQLSAAEAQISAGEQQLAAGKAEYEQQAAAVRAQLAAAESQISDGENQISSGWASLDSGKELLKEKRSEFAAGVKEFKEGEQTLADAEQELAENAELIEELRKARDEGLFPLEDQIAKYDDGVREIAEAKEKLEEAKRELADGERELAQARADLEKGRQELLDGEAELADAKAEYQEGRREAELEFAKAERKINDAREELEDLAEPEWLMFDRRDNTGFESYQGNVQKVEAVCKVFPVFFFLVAALVALTTMTRMVEEDRTQIGTMKALGYSSGSILAYYLLYGGVASVLGCGIGLSIGFKLLPWVIANAYAMMFDMPEIPTPFSWGLALAVGLTTILCILAAAYFSCKNELKERPASLMVPKAPKVGKRILLEKITPIWKRLKFTHKVTARNLFRYKKRFFMTVVGVSGCSALLVTGFGIRDSVGSIVSKQFGELYDYNLTLLLEDEGVWETDPILKDLLADPAQVECFLPFASKTCTVKGSSGEDSSTLQVPMDAEQITDYLVLRDRKTKEPVPFSPDAVVLTEKLAEELGVRVGDPVRLTDSGGRGGDVTVTGVIESYISSYVYLGEDAYRQAFGRAPVYDTLLAKSPAADAGEREAISTRALSSDKVLYSMFNETIEDNVNNSMKSIDSIVVVIIISAGLLSVIVLYNLTNVNICEREKELATIKVLGFFDREVQAYIFRETVLLSLIGTGVGLVLGIWLHQFIIKTIQVSAVMFGQDIEPLSFVYATVISMAFTLLVSLIMRPRIRKIDMVESMKATD